MSDFLDTLAQRNFDETLLHLRPRSMLRFEPASSTAWQTGGEPMLDETVQDSLAGEPGPATPSFFTPSDPMHAPSPGPISAAPSIETPPIVTQVRAAALPLRNSSLALAADQRQRIADRTEVPVVRIEEHHTETIREIIRDAPLKAPRPAAAVEPPSDGASPSKPMPQKSIAPLRDPPLTPEHRVPAAERRQTPRGVPLIPRQPAAARPAPQPVPASPSDQRTSSAPPRIVVERSTPSDSAAGEVHVTIGRIEVRAVPAPAPAAPRPKPATPAVMSLDQYLRRRAGGGS
jgi:hypothetical protein